MTNVKINNKSKIEELNWKDIGYGDVFEFTDKSDDDEIWIGMKVVDEDKDFILALDNYSLYDDIKHYKFLRILDCNIEVG